jgi:hypothetical protein
VADLSPVAMHGTCGTEQESGWNLGSREAAFGERWRGLKAAWRSRGDGAGRGSGGGKVGGDGAGGPKGSNRWFVGAAAVSFIRRWRSGET